MKYIFFGHSYPYTDSRRAVISYWQKYVRLVLVNCLGGLSLPRNSASRLTDWLNLTLIMLPGPPNLKQTNNNSIMVNQF